MATTNPSKLNTLYTRLAPGAPLTSEDMAALLCGVMRANRVARDLAETWYFWHAGLDDLRKTDPYGKDANMARGQISQVLDRAYIALCKGGLS